MNAIEEITSYTKVKIIGGDEVEVKVWNDTVANLSLMALGSSAPEILLSVIEAISTRFEASDLGPATIVGSAAFNLMMITAICIIAVPDRDPRLPGFDVDKSKDQTIAQKEKEFEKGYRKIDQ